MPYHYQTGTAATPTDLKTIFVNFCVGTLGWTNPFTNSLEKISNSANESLHRHTSYLQDPAGNTYFVSTGINGLTVDYRTYIQMGCLDNWADTSLGADPYAYDDLPGYVYVAQTNDITGPYTKYHMFGGQEGVGGNYAYCVIETTVGLFTHFGIGQLDRIGGISSTFAVGVYWNMTVSHWRSVSSSYHNRMFDGWGSFHAGARNHLKINQGNASQYIFSYTGDHAYGGVGAGLNSYLISDNPNAMNGRAMLLPNHIYVNDRGDPDWMRLVGLAPAFRTIRIDNLQPEDIVDTDWMVFPLRAKNAAAGPTSTVYGLAYKFQ